MEWVEPRIVVLNDAESPSAVGACGVGSSPLTLCSDGFVASGTCSLGGEGPSPPLCGFGTSN